MNIFWIKLAAVCFVVLMVGVKAIRGPQKVFARASVMLEIFGVFILLMATQHDDFAANVGAVLMMQGLLCAISMVLVDCAHMIRTKFTRKSIL